MPQFSVAEELSGGGLECGQTGIIEERLMAHSQRWERLLLQSEERWFRELNALRG